MKNFFEKYINKLVLENTARMCYTLTAGAIMGLFGSNILQLNLFGMVGCLIGAIISYGCGVVLDNIRKDL